MRSRLCGPNFRACCAASAEPIRPVGFTASSIGSAIATPAPLPTPFRNSRRANGWRLTIISPLLLWCLRRRNRRRILYWAWTNAAACTLSAASLTPPASATSPGRIWIGRRRRHEDRMVHALGRIRHERRRLAFQAARVLKRVALRDVQHETRETIAVGLDVCGNRFDRLAVRRLQAAAERVAHQLADKRASKIILPARQEGTEFDGRRERPAVDLARRINRGLVVGIAPRAKAVVIL